jgi:hypothetical protein
MVDLLRRSFTGTFLNKNINELHMIREDIDNLSQNICVQIEARSIGLSHIDVDNDVDVLDLVDDDSE